MGEFISENFIIIVIIIGGLLSLLKNKSAPDDDENQKTESTTVSNSYRKNESATTRKRSTNPGTSHTRTTHQSYDTVPIDQQEQRQLKNLQKRMGVSSTAGAQVEDISHSASLETNSSNPEIVKPYHHKEFKKEIKGKLNRKGLIDSIVMAEVLGPPRAKKPYNSIINRNDNK